MGYYATDEARKRHNESAARARARKRGEDVPLLPKGPHPGSQQSAEHLAKRIATLRYGPDHHLWKGDQATKNNARGRARRLIKTLGPCADCGAGRTERHHRDGNPYNNDLSNIQILCRRCHMRADGRLAALGRAQFRKDREVCHPIL